MSSKYNESSLVLPSTEDNSDSLIKTEEFLEFVDDLSQDPSPLSDREGTSNPDTVPSVKAVENSHSINVVDKTSETVNSSNESQDVSIVKVPKGDDVESKEISITESQFSSTMPYCEESLVAKLDPLGGGQFLSAQPCHKEDTTFPHESADLITVEGTSDDSTLDCFSGTSCKIPTEVTHVKFDSVSGINTESQIDHGNLQSTEISNIEPSEPSPSPIRLRRSTRSTRGMPPTRYGSIVSHMVSAKVYNKCKID